MKRRLLSKLWHFSGSSLLLALVISCSATGSLYMHLFLMQPLGRRRLALLMLTAIFLLTTAYLVIHSLLLPTLRKFRKDHLAVLLTGSLLGSLYLLTFSPWQIPVLYLSSNQLEIFVNGEKNPASSGASVELLGFSAEDEFISLSSFTIDGDWQRIGDRMVTSGTKLARLHWRGIARDSVLIFKTSPASGMVHVRYDGYERVYDLYSPETDQLFIHEQSPIKLSGTRLPAIVITVIPLTFLTLTALCILLLAWPRIAVEAFTGGAPIIRDRWLPLIFSVFGVILFFVVSRQFGLWIVGDSVNYTSAARHLISGDGYIALNGDVFDWWPPLYPTLLAMLELLPFPATLIGVRWMHAALLGAIIYFSGLLIQRLTAGGDKWFMSAILLLITIGYPLTESAVYLLSEPLFILLELLFFLWFTRFLESGQRKYALLFTLAAALHALTRYPGVALIFTGCLALLFFPADAIWKRLKRTFLFGFYSSLPLALWMARNYIMTDLFAGVRTPAQLTLADNLRLAGTTIANWFFPPNWNPIAAVLLFGLLAIALAATMMKRQQTFLQSLTNPIFLLLLLFTLIYTVYLIITLSIYHNAQLGNRLLSPIFVPLWLILAHLILQIKVALVSPTRTPGWVNLLALSLILGCLPAPVTAQFTLAQRETITFSTDFSMYSLKNSETLAYLQQNALPGDHMIYSNCHRCLYMFANIQPALPYDSKVSDMYLTPANLPFYIVWFNEVLPEDGIVGVHYPMPEPDKLLGIPLKIKTYAAFSDGTIYLVSPQAW